MAVAGRAADSPHNLLGGEKNHRDAALTPTELLDDPVIEIASSLIEWMRAGGGYLSDKLEIRRRIPGNRTSPSGVFATQDVEEDELLFHIPSNLFLRVQDDEIVRTANENDDLDVYYSDLWKDYYTNTCILMHHLLSETKKYRESPSNTRYEPYIRYLEETQPRGQIPATYSPQGKHLLRDIRGSESEVGSLLAHLDLVDWIDNNLVRNGCFAADDEYAYHAAALAVQRGFDLDLVPIWDLVNHDVFTRTNVKATPIRQEGGLKIWASTPIRAGDEIIYSYNYCADCEDVGEEKGTPGVYQDFGFVEGYPQEWNFVKRNLYVVIEEYDTNRFHADDLHFEDEHGKNWQVPDRADMDFFLAHLSRLGSLDIQSRLENLDSAYERAMIQAYYESVMVAVSSIVQRGYQTLYVPESVSAPSCKTATE